ncbi:MAG TPA: type II CAAX endopeptidase family protein [Blastocatellia bacterium]|nr:type II CAAX endopeptidase family protein [Blastocatellia bacterium]
MQVPTSSSRYCRLCYAVLPDAQSTEAELCERCARIWSTFPKAPRVEASQPDAASYGKAGFTGEQLHSDASAPGEGGVDPDRPRWGPGTGIIIWAVSVAAITLIPLVLLMPFVVVWFFNHQQPGVPTDVIERDLANWVKGPTSVLVQLVATMIAHLITIGVCWWVVTARSTQPFWASLGWKLDSRSVAVTAGLIAIVVPGVLVLDSLLTRLIPQPTESLFEEMLKTGKAVRLTVAVLAVFTAPLVEEVVYRGVLYSGLRKKLSPVPAIAIVSLLFTSVHLLQYWGAWAGVLGLAVLSFVLTGIRAKTRSLFPCFAIHTVHNTIGAIAIIVSGR